MTNKVSAPASLAEQLVRARALAAEMGAATDELNTSLAKAEKAIAALKLGVTARVYLSTDDGSPFFSAVTFGKEKNAWRLLYESGFEGDDDVSCTPLVSASRATRLEAVDKLPELVQALVDTAQKEVEEVRAKTKAVEDLTETIKISEILS